MNKVKTINERAKAYMERNTYMCKAGPIEEALGKGYKAGYRQALKDVYKVVYGYEGDDTLPAVETFYHEIGADSCRVPP